MSLCPKDGKPCMDDMCHGAGCMQMDGYAMLQVCDVCGGIIDEEISECSTCSCDCEPYDDWCDDDDRGAAAQPDGRDISIPK